MFSETRWLKGKSGLAQCARGTDITTFFRQEAG
jgi:hypothetical protein